MANCIVKKRYDELAELGENFLLCAPIYTENSKHKDVNTRYDSDCNFVPQTDGYSGFFIREDATQALEALLHDDSEDRWNIDAVKSDYSNSLVPPCEPKEWYNQFCYIIHRQNFMSHDGVYGLMLGLAAIKRFIPPSATITTCQGQIYSPLSIAVNIASSITNRIDNAFANRIYIPGAEDCLEKPARISPGAGGAPKHQIHGLKKACSYIDGAERHSGIFEAISWGLGAATPAALAQNGNEKMWMRLKTLGWDMGKNNDLYVSSCESFGQNILPLYNNILYPSPPNISIDKQKLKDMLCDSPCSGPCIKLPGYPDNDPNVPTFSCSNTPGWLGQRWETGGNGNNGHNRQFNGLDFMSLYNLYLLHFPEEQTAYFNPDRAEGSVSLGGHKIEGPDVLCPPQAGHYMLLHPQPNTVQNLVWKTSLNLQILGNQGLEADIQANTMLFPSFVEALFNENRQIQQFDYQGQNQSWVQPPAVWEEDGQGQGGGSYVYPPGYWQNYGTITDICDFTYRKPIITEIPEYSLKLEFDHCAGVYRFHALGLNASGALYQWILEVHPSGGQMTILTAQGKDAVNQFGYFPGNMGWVYVTLQVTSTGCSMKEFHTVQFYGCTSGRQVIVAPNPARQGDEVFVGITQDYSVGSNGLDVTFIRTGFGTVQSTQRIYYNGQSVSIANFPVGNYTVQAVLDDNSVVTTTLVVTD